MNIWNINATVTALKEGTINNKQKRSYNIIFGVLISVAILLSIIPSSTNKYDDIDLILFCVINVTGIILLYRIYKKRKRRDLGYYLPYVSLFIPLILRKVLWTILITFFVSLYISFFGPYHYLDGTNPINICINVSTDIVMYLLFIKYFKKVYNH